MIFAFDRIENIVEKGEKAGYCHFSHFQLTFCNCRVQYVVTDFDNHLVILTFNNTLAHLSTECSVSYCDHSPSVSVRPSIHNLLVNTLASTNINQSSAYLVQMCMTTRARMSSIMELIGPELSELSALELENLPYLTMFIL